MLCPDSQTLSLTEIHDKKLQLVCSFLITESNLRIKCCT